MFITRLTHTCIYHHKDIIYIYTHIYYIHMLLDLDSLLQATTYDSSLMVEAFPTSTGLDVHGFAESMLDAKAKAQPMPGKSPCFVQHF